MYITNGIIFKPFYFILFSFDTYISGWIERTTRNSNACNTAKEKYLCFLNSRIVKIMMSPKIVKKGLKTNPS